MPRRCSIVHGQVGVPSGTGLQRLSRCPACTRAAPVRMPLTSFRGCTTFTPHIIVHQFLYPYLRLPHKKAHPPLGTWGESKFSNFSSRYLLPNYKWPPRQDGSLNLK